MSFSVNYQLEFGALEQKWFLIFQKLLTHL